ncbi:F-box protein SKIP14-like [Ananas comosus]|uniref:F-box protein SKIP14-like n=2 Tax=Ananas comosus TaxID=4615 RepID=A0A6P5GG82_ANACO|nr:F-box protein SKIP14-like [Ananas comosus]CAD1820010.1 unnamed protein product [Ananas comosus var. bracteatus]
MAVNFSSCSVLPTPIRGDDDCANSIRSGWDAFGSSYQSGWKFDEPSSSRGKREWGERDDYRDVVDRLPSDPFGMNLETTFTSALSGWIGDVRIISNEYQMGVNHLDPADLLPSDPFGMNLETSFTAAIAGWIGDFRAILGDYQLGGGNDLFAGLSYYCNNALLVPSAVQLNCEGHRDGRGSAFEPVVNLEVLSSSKGPELGKDDCDESIPHDGLLYTLGYLEIQDRLSVERVCKTLRSAILNDPLLWRCIHIHYELGDKLTDDGLVRLTQKAQGNLQCLSVVGCPKITDDGLRHALENCPNLSKLNVSDCVRLTTEGLIETLKAFKTRSGTGIKHLKLGRLLSISESNFEELKLLLGMDQSHQLRSSTKQRFYHKERSSLGCYDNSALDIEICPKCQKHKLVYNCPLETCRQKGPELCRACDFCIARCIQCGKCIKDGEYQETFALEHLCSGCLLSEQ